MKYLLIVEDDSDLREGLAAALSDTSLTAYTAADIASARRMLDATAFDLVLLDCNLPDGSGIPIEERDKDEVRTLYGVQTAPAEVDVYNPAFDVTPHSLVTGIITEKGVIYPPFRENLAKLFG